uniref:Uncharacterized protein n=1 Tax=Kalanchoe fedtschenkoi TaxID=63787 RepID=A0A7N0V4A7_KALFE
MVLALTLRSFADHFLSFEVAESLSQMISDSDRLAALASSLAEATMRGRSCNVAC